MNSTINDMLKYIQANLSEKDKAIRLTHQLTYGKEKGFGQQQIDDYTKLNYHRPSDEYNAAAWKLDGAIDDLQLLFKVGRRLAFEHKWPGWKTGSEFKAIRVVKK